MDDYEESYDPSLEEDDFIVGEDVEDVEEELEDEQNDDYLNLEDSSEPYILPTSSNKIKITSKFLSKYEKCRILGTRSLQISLGSPPTVDIGDITDSYEISLMELQQKKIPIIVRRYLPNGTFEDWNITELELLDE
jgi:DNA-directed RNA polymerase I, II, and III subunit RPABC2